MLSDLHLGRVGAASAGRVDADQLRAVAESLEATHDLVVVNGDLYDLERGSLPSQRYELAVVAAPHAAAVRWVRGPKWVWTAGNHDHALIRHGRAVRAVDVETPAGRVRVEHGHRFDPPIKRWRAFTTFVTWSSGRAKATPGLGPLYAGMRHAERVLGGVGTPSDDPVCERATAWLGVTPRYRALLMGHTHRAGAARCDDGRGVFNPGHSMDHVRALSVDAATGVVSALEWQGDALVPTETWAL